MTSTVRNEELSSRQDDGMAAQIELCSRCLGRCLATSSPCVNSRRRLAESHIVCFCTEDPLENTAEPSMS